MPLLLFVCGESYTSQDVTGYCSPRQCGLHTVLVLFKSSCLRVKTYPILEALPRPLHGQQLLQLLPLGFMLPDSGHMPLRI